MGRHPKPCTLADIKRALTPPANLRERADLCTTFAGGAARGMLETAGQDATRWSRTRRTDIDRLCPEHTVGVSRHRPQGTHYRQRPCDRHGGGRSSCGRQFVAWNMLKL